MTIGVDAFDGNQIVDWNSAKKLGNVGFAILRTNEGTLVDSEFHTYWSQCESVGIKASGFMFLHWITPQSDNGYAEAQANAMLSVMGALAHVRTRLPPVIDVECPGGARPHGVSADNCADQLGRCVRVIYDAIGVWPILYTSSVVLADPAQLAGKVGPGLEKCAVWWKYWPYPIHTQAVYTPELVAALGPPATCAPWHDQWPLQQYQGDAVNLPGFKTYVDMDRVNVVKFGDTGGTVELVQRLAGAAVDGSFGTGTDLAVRQVQRDAGLTADGIVGYDTWSALLWRNH